jgi:hypothetical protein
VILSDLGNFTYFLIDITSYDQTSSSSGRRVSFRDVTANDFLPQVEPSTRARRSSEYL